MTESNSTLEQAGQMLFWPATILAAGAGIVLVLLYKYQNKMLYHPSIPGLPVDPDKNPHGYRNPSEVGVPYESVMIETADGEKVHAWLMMQQEDAHKYPTLIYFHGNAGNMGFRLENSSKMVKNTGINVLAMDYRGYGKSSGEPSEEGLNLDADAVLEYALKHPKLQGSPIVLFGRSLGGAVCVSLAHRFPDKISALVLENTFLSIAAMVDVLMPAVAWAKNLVLRIGWNSEALIGDLKCAILFISGDADELVPKSHMERLYVKASKSILREFYSIPGGTHNDSFIKAGARYYERLQEFLFKEEITGGECFKAKKWSNTEENPAARTSTSAIPTMKKDFSVSASGSSSG